MLLSHRIHHVPALDARLEYHQILHPSFRVLLWRCEGLVLDDSILVGALPLRTASSRSNLFVCLEGEVGVHTLGQGQQLLREADCLLEHRDRVWGVRQESGSLFLSVEWEPGVLGAPVRDPAARSRLPARVLGRLRQAVRPILSEESWNDEVTWGLEETLAILRAEGAPLEVPPVDALRRQVSPVHVAVGRTIDRTLSSLTERPMLQDIELGLGRSPRQARRNIRGFLERYQFNSRGWRDMLQRVRLTTGIGLMSAEKATTEQVAQVLGYSSPTAFCRAFAAAGLPSPNTIRSLVAAAG